MVAIVATAPLAAPLVFVSIAVAVVLIMVLLMCGDKEKGDITSEPQLVAVTDQDSKRATASPTDVVVEDETGETTKRQSNGSVVGQRNSARQNSARQSNGVIEQKDSPEIIRTSPTDSIPFIDHDTPNEDTNEEGDDDYDHIQRKTPFQPKSTTHPYDKVKKDGEQQVVDSTDPYSKVQLQQDNAATAPPDDCDDDYAVVESPTEDKVKFTDHYSKVGKTNVATEEVQPNEDEDFDGHYATVDKTKMSDTNSNPTNVVADDEDETYAEITPPAVPDKNFDIDIPNDQSGAGPSNATADDTGPPPPPVLPTPGNLPPMRQPDPDPRYTAVTARESLESIRQRKSQELVEEDYYSTVGGESGSGTITTTSNQYNSADDLYDEIKGGLSGDGTVGPPPVDVTHLKRIANSKQENGSARNEVGDEPGQLYAQVNKPNRNSSTRESKSPEASYEYSGYDNVEVEGGIPKRPSTSRPSASRKGYEDVDIDNSNVTVVDIKTNQEINEDDDDPNYDTVFDKSENVAVGGANGGGDGGANAAKPGESTGGNFVTTVHVGGGTDNDTPVWSYTKRPHHYEEIDKKGDSNKTIIPCDMVTQI